MEKSLVYFRCSWDRFILRQISDEILVFDLLSGKTHLIPESVSDILSAIDQSPKSFQEIIESIKIIVEADQDELSQFLEESLNRLENIGMIKQIEQWH